MAAWAGENVHCTRLAGMYVFVCMSEYGVCVCVGVCVHVCDEYMTDNSGLFPIQYVDPIVARSFAQLAAVAVK